MRISPTPVQLCLICKQCRRELSYLQFLAVLRRECYSWRRRVVQFVLVALAARLRRPANSRTAAFMNQVKGRRGHLALSGNTTEFEGNAKCESGW